MAILKSSSSLGDYVGKVGTVILSTWKSLCTMKSLHINRRTSKKSEAELTQQQIFKLIMKFLAKPVVQSVIKLGYQEPKKAVMTVVNMATSYHMLHAVVGEPTNPHLDLALLKFSQPIRSTQKLWRPIVQAAPDKKITINWELNPYPQKCTQLDDRLILVFYNNNLNSFSKSGTAIRSDLTYTVPPNFAELGHQVFCYVFMRSADGKLVSETQYLGMVEIQ